MRLKIFTSSLLMMLLSSVFIMGQGQSFVRSALIDPPPTYASGFGTTVSGVDLDNDGKIEIFSVDGMSDFNTGDEIPQIVCYELDGGTWDSVWAASFPNERQNSWAALTTGDLDGDGKLEVIWGFVNSFSTNTTPPRIVVFENGGDNLYGISDGAGNYTPNAQWDMDVPESTNMRPLKWFAYDIDADGTQEVIFAERRDYFNFGVISTSDVPDAGGGTETWTMELSVQSELYDKFIRTGVIPATDVEVGGYGNVIAGMDFDGDGNKDMFLINDNSGDTAPELEPRMYKYELINGAWVEVWKTDISSLVSAQNTWPELTYGDWDKDGKNEVVWLPVNNFANGDSLPYRVVVFEQENDSSDVMGVADGTGNYMPNAKWDMDVPANTDMRPLKAEMYDFDADGNDELVFAERKDFYGWCVIGLDNVPDAGDGTETWTMEAHGDGTKASIYRDMTILDQKMYINDWSNNMTKVDYDGGNYTVTVMQTVPFWSFRSMTTVDLDNNNSKEILAVNYSSPAKVYLLQEDGDTLSVTELADLVDVGISRAPGGNAGDIDGDGYLDYIMGARGADIIARLAYRGGDITDPANYELSILDQGVSGVAGAGNYEVIEFANLDDDASDEVLYTSAYQRGLDAPQAFPLVIGNWYDTLKADAGRRWDMAIANGAAHFFDGSGNVQTIAYENDQWNIYPTQPGVVNGAFLTASAADVDGDGAEEIMVGNWYDAKVNVLVWTNGAWVAHEVHDFSDVGGNRMNGGAVGDIDGDGFMDFICGSRQSVPNAQVYRVEYGGGDVTDMANWRGEVIDQEFNATHTQYEVVNVANLDDDPELEVLYTSDYARGSATAADPQVPLIILDITLVQTTPIADVKYDGNGDFVPDNLGGEFTIKGVVTCPRLSYSSLQIYVQDETAGINIYGGGDDTLDFPVGTLLQITGTVDQYNGLTELAVSNTGENVVSLGVGTVPNPAVLTVDEWLANGEMYEGSLIKLEGTAKVSGDWPATGVNSNITMWDGYMEFTMRIDKDLDLAGQPEPVYPIDVTGIGSQYDSNTPPDGGYQIFPRYYTDIVQNVSVPPSPYFFMLTPADGAVLSIGDSSDTFDFTWEDAIDLNGDAILYQWFTVGDFIQSPALTTPAFSLDALTLLAAMGGADTVDYQWTVRAKGSEQDFVTSVDTFSVRFINDIQVGVDDELIPKKFYVAQNYPNPFNPTTTIRFGLPEEATVDLRVYDILGQEVMVLLNSQSMKAANHEVVFNASILASGTYIYRLTAGDKVVTKKMLLLK